MIIDRHDSLYSFWNCWDQNNTDELIGFLTKIRIVIFPKKEFLENFSKRESFLKWTQKQPASPWILHPS